MIHLSVADLDRAQDANIRMLAALKPSSALGRAVQTMTALAQQGTIRRVHVDMGAYRSSLREQIEGGGLQGRVFISPDAVNPRSRVRVSVYGPIEEARGGSHAAFARTYYEEGEAIVQRAGNQLLKELG